MTLNDLKTNKSESLTSKASFWHIIFKLLIKFLFWPLSAIFDLWWPLMTSGGTFLKTSRQELHFEVQFVYFQSSSKFDLFWDFWPFMTFNDLETNFFENLTSRASFWGIIWLFSCKFEIWPFWPFFVIFDLEWPRVTLKIVFVKRRGQELHFDV